MLKKEFTQWQEGWRSQDTNGYYSNNKKSAEFHLDGRVDSSEVKRSFCIKSSTTGDHNRTDWPPGQYCIYQFVQCPTGFTSGYVYWDDDDYLNANDASGTLPNGEYGGDTKIYFCCKTDGDKTDPIILPSNSPFFLLAYKSAKCQKVKWTVDNVEWIKYDTEHWDNKDEAVDWYPHEAGIKHPTIYYCYYRGCNETLTAVNGTFQSPNYPDEYPNGQYCSWRIVANTTPHIHLMFTNFVLQNENNTDALYIYDGENSTGVVLGVFYGGHPPPQEGIYSSSSRMFVIFKSDKTVSYTGFSASYYAVNKSGPSGTTTQTPYITPKTAHTPVRTTSTREQTSTIDGPTKEGGKKDERKKPQGKGFNVVAVVVPVVLVVFLVAVLIAAFFYLKRKRTEKDAKPNKVIFSASDLVIANTNEACFSQGNDMYTEVEDTEKTNKKERYMEQQNENPLYEGADTDAVVLNPVYNSGLVIANTNEPRFSEDEMYTDVKELENKNEKPYTEQKNENPLYEAADVDVAVLNPIYDSST
ncbi:hypothetical protein ACROYT_G042729 [Oculina patagonica]